MLRKKDSVRFIGRSHSKKGIFSSVIGVLVLILLFVLALMSGLEEGQGGQALGGAATIGFILSGAGFIWAVSSLKEKDIFYAAPIIGVVLNGGMFIVYMILYVIGLM